MPVYLIHGFRWGRVKIRHHIILNNVEEGMPEYIMTASSTKAILDSFETNYPEIMSTVPKIRFMEQYDPSDVSSNAQSQPYAYVCDAVIKGGISIDIDQTRSHSIPASDWQAMADLRDALEPEATLGWFAVYNGDEERADQMFDDDFRPPVRPAFKRLQSSS